MRPQAEDLVRKDLALEAVVAAEGIEVTDEMVEAWVREQAPRPTRTSRRRSSG